MAVHPRAQDQVQLEPPALLGAEHELLHVRGGVGAVEGGRCEGEAGGDGGERNGNRRENTGKQEGTRNTIGTQEGAKHDGEDNDTIGLVSMLLNILLIVNCLSAFVVFVCAAAVRWRDAVRAG